MVSQTSSIYIRSADLQSDRSAIIELFRRCLNPDYGSNRFDWLYLKGPHGKAKAWIAEQEKGGEIIGAAAGFPRKMCCDGKPIVGLVFGDFCVCEQFRTLGPALHLQRACLEAVQEPPFEFFYDFPSTGMMAVYKRLRIAQSGELRRWAKPLRAEEKIQRVVKSKMLTQCLTVISNLLLAHRGWKGPKDSCELATVKGSCGEEFTLLNAEFRQQQGLVTDRTAEYLNWRYLAHPSIEHEIMTANREGKLIGYIVFTKDKEDPAIVDLCANEEAVAARLIYGAGTVLRSRGAATINLNAGETHPWNQLFQRTGFRQRETAPTVIYASRASSISETNLSRSWHLMRGERDG